VNLPGGKMLFPNDCRCNLQVRNLDSGLKVGIWWDLFVTSLRDLLPATPSPDASYDRKWEIKSLLSRVRPNPSTYYSRWEDNFCQGCQGWYKREIPEFYSCLSDEIGKEIQKVRLER
jgi:hypothetical protein